jgi:hypothetical protein
LEKGLILPGDEVTIPAEPETALDLLFPVHTSAIEITSNVRPEHGQTVSFYLRNTERGGTPLTTDCVVSRVADLRANGILGFGSSRDGRSRIRNVPVGEYVVTAVIYHFRGTPRIPWQKSVPCTVVSGEDTTIEINE